MHGGFTFRLKTAREQQCIGWQRLRFNFNARQQSYQCLVHHTTLGTL